MRAGYRRRDMYETTPVNKRPGDVFQWRGHWWSICRGCRGLVKLDKRIIGSLHLCDPKANR